MCSKRKIVILKTEKIKIRLTKKTAGVTNGEGCGMIYCVEDERNIRELLVYTLETTGFEAEGFETGVEFDAAMKKSLPELILLDIMLPGEDGMEILKKLKTSGRTKDIPVIMLSARGEEYDKLFGFEMGVDDYVVKPFSPKEVLARINAIIKRNKSGNEPVGETVKFEGLEINFTARDVFIDGEKANLTPKEYDLLFYLVKNKNIALTRNKLLEEVWGYDFFGDDRTIDTHIKMLRNNLGPYRKFIVTLRGMGYKFQV